MQNSYEKRGNTFTGFIGALIGALAGTLIWILIGRKGYVSGLVGLLTAVVSGQLYDSFGGKPGAAKTVIVVICVLVTVFAGTAGAMYVQSSELYDEELEECVELFMQYPQITEAEARAEAKEIMEDTYGGKIGHFKFLLALPENEGLFAENLAPGLLFAAIGCIGIIIGNRKAAKNGNSSAAEYKDEE